MQTHVVLVSVFDGDRGLCHVQKQRFFFFLEARRKTNQVAGLQWGDENQ